MTAVANPVTACSRASTISRTGKRAVREAANPTETLHLYALYPGLMRVYDAPGKRTLTLMEGAGAWLPADPTRVLAEARWNMG